MEIKFLKAGSGDSIVIHHNTSNIIIDGGNDSTYLIKQIEDIFNRNETINLLVITHHDDDHIKGIIDSLKFIEENNYNENKTFIKKVIFNSPRLFLKKIPTSEKRTLSYKQAYELEELLLQLNINWSLCDETTDSIEIENIKLNILSPTKTDLNTYSNQKGAYLASDNRCDWSSSLAILDKHLDDKSQDNTVSNNSSIVLQLLYEDKNILLTGDVTPSRLENIIKKMYSNNHSQRVKFDFIKLPHHGSYRSLNRSILEKIDCSTFIISTNSKKYYLPNKRALLKILKYMDRTINNRIKFLFNYEEAINNLKISNKELQDYNFELKANNQPYGISIR